MSGTRDNREQRVRDVLDGALRKLGVRGQVRDAQLAAAFAEVVGPALSAQCRALRLERDTLLVAADSGPLAHQLRLEAPRIIAGVNARVGAELVRRLRFGHI